MLNALRANVALMAQAAADYLLTPAASRVQDAFAADPLERDHDSDSVSDATGIASDAMDADPDSIDDDSIDDDSIDDGPPPFSVTLANGEVWTFPDARAEAERAADPDGAVSRAALHTGAFTGEDGG